MRYLDCLGSLSHVKKETSFWWFSDQWSSHVKDRLIKPNPNDSATGNLRPRGPSVGQMANRLKELAHLAPGLRREGPCGLCVEIAEGGAYGVDVCLASPLNQAEEVYPRETRYIK